MKPENLIEAQIAWIIWNLHERLNNLLWDRYQKEFLDWVMDENQKGNGSDDGGELDRLLDESQF